MILTILLLIISACAFSVMYTLLFHFKVSIFKNLDEKYWNPVVSNNNKYKPETREPKFFGSTTFLVWTTDWFHRVQLVATNSFILSIAINIESYPWYFNFIELRLMYGIVWWILFEHVLIKK
jgi:hypothetical protein